MHYDNDETIHMMIKADAKINPIIPSGLLYHSVLLPVATSDLSLSVVGVVAVALTSSTVVFKIRGIDGISSKIINNILL
jgi:hypothetical protein